MSRDELLNFVRRTFAHYGIKTVSPTDIDKSAYVPNMQQKEVFASLGINPLDRRQDIQIRELFSNKILTISYYATLRVGAGRSPEPRMGLSDLISYLAIGDEVLFASDGIDIFIYNLSNLSGQDISNDEAEERLCSQVDIRLLQNKVQNMDTTPVQTQREVTVFARNNALRALVKLRASYSCEMPNCEYVGFEKKDGEKYIEVHHLTPLSDGGEDSILNTVALCPTCHRKMHYSQNKEELKRILAEYIISLY